MMAAPSEVNENTPQPPEIYEIQEIEGPEAITTILNYCQLIFKTVQRLEKKLDDMDEKVTKIYRTRSRSFWNYPVLRSVARKYNYLTSKRVKEQKVNQVDHDNSFTYPQSYSPTSPVRRREAYNQDMENIESMDYSLPLQYTNPIDNSQTFQYTDTVNNNQTIQYTDTVDLSQTIQYTDTVDLSQTIQYTDTVDLSQTIQYTDTVDNVQPFHYTSTVTNMEVIRNTENNAVFHSENSQEVEFARSSPERDYQETPPSPVYTTQTYEQYYRLKDIPGSSTMPYYSNLEIPNMDTITSATSTAKEASSLPPGELIPIQNPEMRQMALLEAQLTPVIDPNTFGSSPECNSVVVRHLGDPINWSVNDVITFLNRLDPPLADKLYLTIRNHDIDGKAMLLINNETMIKYMGVKVGVAMKFADYIEKLKQGVNCGQ
ncbi:sex comb on midleg-like protein 1 [Arvicanthis niloticus]|uniref:sex comb on midleg-like protein 1 n=1 Tax=Arvicanthis niloticus TaxID=61156 RepID=UPI001486A523|nr:sex comb on midleg-like protein 1 [Arvicanthis niloticus]